MPPLRAEYLLAQLDLLVSAPARFAQAQTDQDHEHDGDGEEEERGAPRPDGGHPGAEQDADDGADADTRAVRRVDAGTGRDGVVVGQQGVVGGEDHGLPHGDADQHDGGHHHGLGQSEADGEGGADKGADQRDAHPVRAVSQDGDGERAGEGRRAGDRHDEQDAGIGEVERVADVRRQHVEGALGGLVQQLDREEDPQGEQRGPGAELGEPVHGAGTGCTGPPSPAAASPLRRTRTSTTRLRRS